MTSLSSPAPIPDFPWKGYDPEKTPKLYLTIDRFLARRGIKFGSPILIQTTGGKHSKTSLHYFGRARDYGHTNSDVFAIAAALEPLARGPNPRLVELFWAPKNVFWKRGVEFDPSRDLFQMHLDHVHASLAQGATLDDVP